MTLGSLFDGIGGWLLAARHAGVMPVWASEIESFPCAVTARHFPDVKQLGDITQIDADKIEPVDIVCAGSPCQDLSIAGKRKGLDGERSGLFRTAAHLVRRMQMSTGGRYPRYVVWENVPGAFSSNKGADFRSVLEDFAEAEIPMPENNKWADSGMVECDKCEIAWRVLDAQYWGVPQRRKRIFLVADFGAGRRCAEQILFEPQGVSRHPAAGADTREETPCGAEGGAHMSSTLGFDACASVSNNAPVLCDCAPTLKTTTRLAVYDMTHADEVMREVTGGKVQTLNARMGTGGNQVPVIHAYGIQGNIIGRQPQNGGNGTGITVDCAPTLTAMDRHAVYARKSYSEYAADDVAASLKASGGCYGGGSENISRSYGYVRRLTPLECERLQGLPDNWTLIDDASCSDTSRYKAIGNGMAQPCADWILRRIRKETEK